MEKKKQILNVIKSLGFWMVVLLYFEVSFRLSMQYSFNLESMINIVLYSLIIGAFFCFVFQSVNPGKAKIFIGVTLFGLGFLFSLQCVFFKIFKTYFSLSSLELKDQVGDFMGQAFSQIFKNSPYILLFLLPFILFCIFRKKLRFERNLLLGYIANGIIFGLAILLLNVHIDMTKSVTNGSYDLYHNVNIAGLNCEKFGILNAYRIDFLRYEFGFEEELVKEVNVLEEYAESEVVVEEEEPIVYEYHTLDLNFEKTAPNEEIQNINAYLKEDLGTQKNPYTGMFQGYNLVYITAESFYQVAISEEITPTLYRLTNSGFVFENYYTPNVLSTIGGEFQSLTGLFPSKDILPTWRTGNNYFPYGLATVFRGLGYSTFAYHDNGYTFQDRNKYLKSQGFTNYLAIGNGLEKKINSNIWPESDVEMMEATVPDYIGSESPFLAYYMTVSGHMDYDFDGNNVISLWHRDVVKDLDATEEAKAYVATQVELDRALEKLISELEAGGKLDNTVIVLLADHYPYALSKKAVDSLSSYQRDDVVEINHNSLIIWNSQMETVDVSKTCMSCDVLPTVLNLFGVDYDARLFTGRDILSNSGGLAIMENRSWVTDKGTYFSTTGEFVSKNGEEVSSDYIENVNNIVRNRLNVAKWIVKNNYYHYLFY